MSAADMRAEDSKVYTLWTFGGGTNHVTTDKELAERWAASNFYRGYTAWDSDLEREQITAAIEAEEMRRKEN